MLQRLKNFWQRDGTKIIGWVTTGIGALGALDAATIQSVTKLLGPTIGNNFAIICMVAGGLLTVVRGNKNTKDIAKEIVTKATTGDIQASAQVVQAVIKTEAQTINNAVVQPPFTILPLPVLKPLVKPPPAQPPVVQPPVVQPPQVQPPEVPPPQDVPTSVKVSKMETLGQHQRRFLPLLAKLIEYAYAQGYELTGGAMLRTPEEAMHNAMEGKGVANSLHLIKLAVDLNLFKDGVYLKDSSEYKFLGDYWKTLNPACAWGGDFQRKDGNHFSLTWNGVQ